MLNSDASDDTCTKTPKPQNPKTPWAISDQNFKFRKSIKMKLSFYIGLALFGLAAKTISVDL